MIRLLRENNVLAVKGNNDFSVERMLTDERRRPDSAGEPTIAYLRTVPFTRALNGLLFAHSLPYDSLRSFYEPIDTGNTQRAARLFAETRFPAPLLRPFAPPHPLPDGGGKRDARTGSPG